MPTEITSGILVGIFACTIQEFCRNFSNVSESWEEIPSWIPVFFLLILFLGFLQRFAQPQWFFWNIIWKSEKFTLDFPQKFLPVVHPGVFFYDFLKRFNRNISKSFFRDSSLSDCQRIFSWIILEINLGILVEISFKDWSCIFHRGFSDFFSGIFFQAFWQKSLRVL